MGFFSSEVTDVVDSVGETIDNIFTSDDERLKARNMLQEIKNKSKEIDLKVDEEITKRWSIDKDGFLTRNIRPLSYAFMIGLFGYMVLSQTVVNESYLPTIEAILVTMTIALFGSRGIEKATKLYKGK